MAAVEIMARVERRRKWTAAEKAALLAELEAEGGKVAVVARRHRVVTDARLEIDNNIAENAMRGIALGRKNYLFAGSDIGGGRAASMYTIVQTAKLNGVNPETYLRGTLKKIAEGHPISRIQDLMPWLS
jgi:hypothetical protein